MTQHMTDSRFHMWRTLVALVHIDHQITEEERAFFLDRLHRLSFTEEQENIIKDEMGEAQDVTALFEKITDKEDRATLIYFARLLFWSDGEFVMQEEKSSNPYAPVSSTNWIWNKLWLMLMHRLLKQ